MEDLRIVYLSPDELTPYENNARRHGEEDVRIIENSIKENGFLDPIGVWGENNVIVEGHGRLIAAQNLGLDRVPCIRLDHLTDEQRREYALTHNRSAELSMWDFATLEDELNALEADFDMNAFGFDAGLFDSSEKASADSADIDGEQNEIDRSGEAHGSLAEKYLVPPFSVIYANKPDWLARKRAWVAKGLRSETGRGGTCLQFKEQSRGKLPTLAETGGGDERSKAFKNNSRLNSYMTDRKPSRREQSAG